VILAENGHLLVIIHFPRYFFLLLLIQQLPTKSTGGIYMPRKRTDVEKIREILRLSCDLKLSIRKIAEALEISKTVSIR
jgi:hypothetical protein